jgi:hypothetical protein
MNKKNIFLGLLLIILGILAIVKQVLNVQFLTMGTLWPLFLLVPGLCFEYGYFVNRKDAGLLVPGGILTTIGALFLFLNLTSWRLSRFTWPVYPLAVAIGLYQLYIFGGRDKGLLIPVGILTAVSLISFANMAFAWLNAGIVFAAALILIGLSILFKGSNRR